MHPLSVSKVRCYDGTYLLPYSACGQRWTYTTPDSTRYCDTLGLLQTHHMPMACTLYFQNTVRHPAARPPVKHGESPHTEEEPKEQCLGCGLRARSPA